MVCRIAAVPTTPRRAYRREGDENIIPTPSSSATTSPLSLSSTSENSTVPVNTTPIKKKKEPRRRSTSDTTHECSPENSPLRDRSSSIAKQCELEEPPTTCRGCSQELEVASARTLPSPTRLDLPSTVATGRDDSSCLAPATDTPERSATQMASPPLAPDLDLPIQNKERAMMVGSEDVVSMNGGCGDSTVNNDDATVLAERAQLFAKESWEEQQLRYYVDLSSQYEQQGDLRSSMQVLEQVLARTKKTTTTPNVIFTDELRRAYLLYRSGRLLWKMGDYANSSTRLRQARDLYERQERGQSSEILVEIYADLGKVARSTGQVKQAKRYYMKALRTTEFDCLFSGGNSTTTSSWLQAKVLRQMGLLMLDRGRYEKAGTALHEAARLQQQQLADNDERNAEYAFTLLALGQYYETALGDYEQAAGFYLDSLDIYRAQATECRVDMAVVLSRIGWLYYLAGEYQEARNVYHEAHDLLFGALGNDSNHMNIASIHLQIGMIYSATQQWERALIRYKKALHIQRCVHGDNHESVAKTLCLIATCYNKSQQGAPHHPRSQERLNRALQCVLHSLHIRVSLLGQGHLSVGQTFVQLSSLQFQVGQAREAVDSISSALEIYHDHGLSSSHELVQEARAAMKNAKQSAKKSSRSTILLHAQSNSVLRSHPHLLVGDL